MYEYKTQLLRDFSGKELGIIDEINEEAKKGWRIIDISNIRTREVTMIPDVDKIKFLTVSETYGIIVSAIITFERKIDA